MIIRNVIEGLTPLEIWDCILGNYTLWDCMCQPSFPVALHKTVQLLIEGAAVSKSCGPSVSCPQKFDSIYISGGGVLNEKSIAQLHDFKIPVIIADDRVLPVSMFDLS